jgi:hypothetical protein
MTKEPFQLFNGLSSQFPINLQTPLSSRLQALVTKTNILESLMSSDLQSREGEVRDFRELSYAALHDVIQNNGMDEPPKLCQGGLSEEYKLKCFSCSEYRPPVSVLHLFPYRKTPSIPPFMSSEQPIEAPQPSHHVFNKSIPSGSTRLSTASTMQ